MVNMFCRKAEEQLFQDERFFWKIKQYDRHICLHQVVPVPAAKGKATNNFILSLRTCSAWQCLRMADESESKYGVGFCLKLFISLIVNIC